MIKLTKKKLRLKREIKERLQMFVFYALCFCGIALCLYGLYLQDQHELKRAISRCGSENNIVEHYTKDGDTYYTCKVEK